MTNSDLLVKSDGITSGTRIAPLTNVRLFLELADKLVNRPSHLPGIGCFYGWSGVGKSQSGINAATKYNAAYVEVGESWTPTTLLQKIHFELSGVTKKGTKPQLMSDIVEMLVDTGRLLIIDEADYLRKQAMIDLVREISDNSGAAVILIGEELLPDKLAQFERAHNRVLRWQPAMPCDLGDAKKLAQLWIPEIDIANDLLSDVVEITRGVTRRITENFEDIREFAAERNLKKVDRAAWGGRAIYTGRAPQRQAAKVRAK